MRRSETRLVTTDYTRTILASGRGYGDSRVFHRRLYISPRNLVPPVPFEVMISLARGFSKDPQERTFLYSRIRMIV